MKKFARKWNGMVVDQPQQNKDFPILYTNEQCRFMIFQTFKGSTRGDLETQ
jgi:hypothetical protein